MAVTSTTSPRRFLPGRRTLVALAVGAGVALSPMPAFAATTAPAAVAQPAATAAAQAAVNTAMAQLGKPYAYGAAGPGSFDCSGLVQYSYRAAGIALPRTTGALAGAGTPVSINAMKPGDLVFFYGGTHVGIYIGNSSVVHAPTAGDVVKITNDHYMPISGARRIA